ncbi:PLAC8-domain-containing protein [Apiospora sp. TS-2023a]
MRPSSSPAMQFADLKQPQPMASPVVMQQPPQQYPGVPAVGSPPPPSFYHPHQRMVTPIQSATAAPMPVHNQTQALADGHGAHLSPWSAPIFDCFNPADQLFMACFCPCIVFGKTRARLRDPSMATYDTVNSDVSVIHGLTNRASRKEASADNRLVPSVTVCDMECPEHVRVQLDVSLCLWSPSTLVIRSIAVWMARKEIRVRFSIKGDSAEDAMLTLCCPVCALVQEEKEVVRRIAQQQVQQPPPSTGYMAQPPMHMPIMQVPMQAQMQMQPTQQQQQQQQQQHMVI